MTMTRSEISNPIQGFRVDAHENLDSSPYTYTPGSTDIAFRVGEESIYYLGDASTVQVVLPAGSSTVIGRGLTYTFTAATVIEIMR